MALSSVSKSFKFSVANPAGAKKRVAKMLDISILVPVMNEAGNIRPLIDEICTAMAGRQFEIIYIDDASDDAEWIGEMCWLPSSLCSCACLYLRISVHFCVVGTFGSWSSLPPPGTQGPWWDQKGSGP